MAMKLVKKTDQYSIYKRGDERYAVKDASKRAVNGEAKVQVLLEADLIKATLSKKPADKSSIDAESATAGAAVSPDSE